VVYGGGGITPDVVVHPAEVPDLARRALGRGLFFEFAVHYAGQHPDLAEPRVTKDVMAELREFLLDEGVDFTEAEFDSAAPSLEPIVARELARRLRGSEQAAVAALESDAQVRAALSLLRSASGPEDLLKSALQDGGAVE